MKKALAFILLVTMLLSTLCSCGGKQPQGNKNQLGDYEVDIYSRRLAYADGYGGGHLIIIKYKFTNNSDEPASFFWSVVTYAYQNGISLDECYLFDFEKYNYSDANQTKNVKPGYSIDVEVAYYLNDSETDVVVDVYELLSTNDKKVTRTFPIVYRE